MWPCCVTRSSINSTPAQALTLSLLTLKNQILVSLTPSHWVYDPSHSVVVMYYEHMTSRFVVLIKKFRIFEIFYNKMIAQPGIRTRY